MNKGDRVKLVAGSALNRCHLGSFQGKQVILVEPSEQMGISWTDGQVWWCRRDADYPSAHFCYASEACMQLIQSASGEATTEQKEQNTMLYAVTLMKTPNVSAAQEEISAPTEEFVAVDDATARLLFGAKHSKEILSALDEKARIRLIVRQIG